MPQALKIDWPRTMVRMRVMPARLNAAASASSSTWPRPCSRASGRTESTYTQPQGAEPNSQARISPSMKPSTAAPPSSGPSATRK